MTPAERHRAPGSHEVPGPEELPAHVTLPLLTLITQQSLDGDYAHVAERRRQEAEAGTAPVEDRRRSRRWITLATVAVCGLLATTAAVQTNRNAQVTELGRTTLVGRVQEQKDQVEQAQDRIGQLRSEVAAADAERQRIADEQRRVNRELRRLEVRTGFGETRGPGIRIEITERGDELVRDEDLARLVDGLWAAGAEAIEINDQRLTVLSSISAPGQTIHVNGRPVNPPYTVYAIGDPSSLQARLLDSVHGAQFLQMARSLQFDVKVAEEDQLRLPAALLRPLRHTTEWAEGTTRDMEGESR